MNRLNVEIAQASVSPVEVDDQGCLIRKFRFPKEFVGFSGHFPGYPIVPAIVQVLAAQLLAESGLAGAHRLQSMDNAKFLLQIRPDQEITIRCHLKWEGEVALAEARLQCPKGLAATFTLRFSPERSAS